MDGIYLDNAASTVIHPDVKQIMSEWDSYANAGSIHKVGIESKRKLKEARDIFASILNCESEQIIFTSGGSESNATVLRGHISNYDACGWENNICISTVEHESVCKNALIAHRSKMFDTPFSVGVNADGCIDMSALRKVLATPDADVKLVSIMASNNEIPVINNVRAIASICHEYGADYHADCVQAFGSVDLDVNDLGCDFMSFSAHKFHGPKGVGVLFCKDKSKIVPLIAGGENQEFGIRGGTENVSGIYGAAIAAQIAINEKYEVMRHISLIKHRFYEELMSQAKSLGIAEKVRINGVFDDERAKLLSITLEDVDAQSLVLMMSARNAYISAGSACTASSTESSHVLKAIGLTDKQAHSTVRVSFSRYNTESEVVEAAGIMLDSAMKLMP